MKKFLNDFKSFAIKGNVIDMAVGIIIGSAFTAIVNSLVNDMLMPLLTFITKGMDVDYAAMKIELIPGNEATFIQYGNFISAIISFLLIAVVVFVMVRLIKRASDLPKMITKKEDEESAPADPPRLCDFCRMEIAKDATRCPHCTSILNQ